jgi:hypothetical protein
VAVYVDDSAPRAADLREHGHVCWGPRDKPEYVHLTLDGQSVEFNGPTTAVTFSWFHQQRERRRSLLTFGAPLSLRAVFSPLSFSPFLCLMQKSFRVIITS